MSSAVDQPASRPALGLSFTATVRRELLHRQHPDEAFLTDAVRTGPLAFVAAAVLPAGHRHYAAHTGPSRHRDPLLLLECARQAETYAAHTMFEIEPDAHFVLRHWSAEFSAPAGEGPSELLITGVTSNPRLVRDRIRGLDWALELRSSGERLGQVRMSVDYLGDAAYRVIRGRRHQGTPPLSDEITPPPASQVAPAEVGRLRPTDVLLSDVQVTGAQVRAGLWVPVDNASLFDHAQDHIPAMVLMEAGRQLAALATGAWGGPSPERTELVAMSSSFSAYAELTEPIELIATRPPAAGSAVEVSFQQAGGQITEARLVMAVRAPVTEAGRGRGTAWSEPR